MERREGDLAEVVGLGRRRPASRRVPGPPKA